MAEEWRRDGYLISTDKSLLDLDAVCGFLERSYWAAQRPRDVISRSIEKSLNFGLYRPADRRQVGFARVVSDCATFGWLCDVFIDEDCRGRGLGVWLIETVMAHPDLRGLLMMLGTRDAHGLYERFGFRPMPLPERWMARWEA